MGRQIVRRLGSTPRERGSDDNGTCPDLFELSDGMFAVIGTDVAADQVPEARALRDGERLVVVPREMLIAAKRDMAG